MLVLNSMGFFQMGNMIIKKKNCRYLLAKVNTYVAFRSFPKFRHSAVP